MHAGHHQRVKQLFEAVRALDPLARDSYLLEHCSDDDLVADVRSLLAAHDGADGFLEQPAIATDLAAAGSAPDRPPRRIGSFTVIRLLGIGGMGMVCEAEQQTPRRRIAVKIVAGAFARPELEMRLRREAELLGRVRHPGIAQVYQAGAGELIDADGVSRGEHPYLAMELVDGVSVTAYARSARLDRSARLNLVATICDAVQAAHRAGVIHRDLKPANVLVTADGAPKILDFGIARPTDAETLATMRTRTGQIVGTLPYMSPEHVAGDGTSVDTRSDVYSLGVMLYELLSGRLPYELSSSSIADAARTIREDEPAPLHHTRRLRRDDVETIVEKAMRKAPDERYQSAGDLAADIRRLLRDEPILARPQTTWYQLRTFARRNRALVAGVAGMSLALLIGAIVATVFAVGEMRARADAQHQQRIAVATVEFLTEDVLGAVDHWNYGDTSVTLRDALDAASERIDGRFPDEPLVEAAVRISLARSYRHLAEPDLAALHAERTLALLRDTIGDDDLRLAEPLLVLATVAAERGEGERTERLHREALALQQAHLPADDPALIGSMIQFGWLLVAAGRFDEAESTFRDVLQRQRSRFGTEHEEVAAALHYMGYVLRVSGQFDAAEPFCRDALELRHRLHGAEHHRTAITLRNLAALHHDRGDFDAAEPLYRDALTILRASLGEEHVNVSTTLDNLGCLLRDRGDLDAAEPMLANGLEQRVRARGNVAISRSNLGYLHVLRGDIETAAPLLEAAHDVQRPRNAPGDPYLADTLIGLGALRLRQHRAADAEPLLREGLEIRAATAGLENFRGIDVRLWLAECLLELGRTEDARKLIAGCRSTLEGIDGALPGRRGRIVELEVRAGAGT